MIQILFSGPSSFQFPAVQLLPVTILSSLLPKAAPRFLRAIFSSDGSNFLFWFDSPTDYGGFFLGSWPCNNLFLFLGSDTSSCLWLNSSVVQAIFAQKSLPNVASVGANVTLIGNKVRAACDFGTNCTLNALAQSRSKVVLAPLSPTPPSVIFQTSPVISSCSNLVVDVTSSYGNAGRPWKKITWTVINIGPKMSRSVSIMDSTLNDAQSISEIFTFTPLVTNITTYVFTLELENFLGARGLGSAVIEVSSDAFIPQIQIQGSSSLNILASSDLLIRSTAVLPPCAGLIKLDFQW